MYKFIKLQFRMKRITVRDVWKMADAGRISAEQAYEITGVKRLG